MIGCPINFGDCSDCEYYQDRECEYNEEDEKEEEQEEE